MKPYEGKKIWIIGASSGIGEALARELAAQGAYVILSARSEDKLNAIHESLGRHHTVLPVNAGDAKGLEKAAQALDNLDSVIFMAALYAPHSNKTKDISFINDMITVNIGGAFNTVNAVLPIFEKQGFGQIALCGSVAGYRGLPYGQPYCATKAAIINYAESLKIELEDKNFSYNADTIFEVSGIINLESQHPDELALEEDPTPEELEIQVNEIQVISSN